MSIMRNHEGALPSVGRSMVSSLGCHLS